LALAFIALILFVKAAAGVFRLAIHFKWIFWVQVSELAEKSEKLC
jgi:hypothetical protein